MLSQGNSPFGKISSYLRRWVCSKIFNSIGKNVNIEKGAYFGNGLKLVIGNNSGIEVNCRVPFDTIIGNYVMMGPECVFTQF